MSGRDIVDVDLTDWVIEDENERIEAGEDIDGEKEEKPDDTEDEESSEDSTDETSSEDEDGESKEDEEKPDEDAEKEDAKPEPQWSEATEVDIDGQKITIGEAFKAFRDRRDQQADYTRKTQALADRRREFEVEEKEFTDTWERRIADPNELMTYLKRTNPSALHNLAVAYGTEYQQLQELAKENPAEYQRYLNDEQQRLSKINQEEKNKRFVRKERNRIRNVLENHVEPELEAAGLLPKRHGKAYKQLVMSEWYEAYREFCSNNRGAQITEEVVKQIAQSLKKNKELVSELKHDQERYKERDAKKDGKNGKKDKPKPKVRAVNQDKPTRKQQKENVTHENFFDRFV